MSKKVIIDLMKLRDLESCRNEAVDSAFLKGSAFKTIRELAIFRFTCRKCEDAPCIASCPADALEKGEDGIISRALNQCVRCKSCVVICPFGTIMNDLFETKTAGYQYFDLNDEKEMEQFADAYPEGTVRIVDVDKNEEGDFYELSDKVLVRDFIWDRDSV